MDDLLFVSYEDDANTAALIALVQHLFDMFGLTINKEKSVLTPSASVDFLGYTVSADGVLAVSQRRFNRIRTFAKQLL